MTAWLLSQRRAGLTVRGLLLACLLLLWLWLQFIFYAVVTNILSLERTILKKKLVDGRWRAIRQPVASLDLLLTHTSLISA